MTGACLSRAHRPAVRAAGVRVYALLTTLRVCPGDRAASQNAAGSTSLSGLLAASLVAAANNPAALSADAERRRQVPSDLCRACFSARQSFTRLVGGMDGRRLRCGTSNGG